MPRFTTTVDVLVVGAGAAGMAAAITASRHGMKALLIESEASPGGTLAWALHTVICGLYGDRPADVADTLNGGLPRELAVSLAGPRPRPLRVGTTHVLPFDLAELRHWFGQVSRATPELEVRYGSTVTEVHTSAGRAESARTSDGDSVGFGALIDCTGEAAAGSLAGAELLVDPPETRQLAGYAMSFEGLRGDLSMLPLAAPYHLARAVADGDLPAAARFASFMPTNSPGQAVCKLAVPLDLADDPGGLRDYVDAVCVVLFDKVDAMDGATLAARSPRAVPRDGPRLRGRALLTEDDIMSARKAGPEAVRAAWPIEFWHPVDGPTYCYLPAGEHYEIPDACLASAGVRNLFCAGRCLSATLRAAASARVAGVCLGLGQAAARAAAASIGKGWSPA